MSFSFLLQNFFTLCFSGVSITKNSGIFFWVLGLGRGQGLNLHVISITYYLVGILTSSFLYGSG